MKRNSFLQIRPAAVMLVLIIGMCGLGVGYGAWTDNLSINTFVSSGSFAVAFDQDRPYSVQVMEISGATVDDPTGANEIDCILEKDGRQARISFNGALLLDELVSGDRFLTLQYPLTIGENSTIKSVTPYQADLTLPSQERVEFTPVSSQLIADGEEYALPDVLEELNVPLFWDVYRQVETDNDQITGTIFLKLSDESIDALQNPTELSIDAAELSEELAKHIALSEGETSGLLQAEIDTNYSFSLALYIEQSSQ